MTFTAQINGIFQTWHRFFVPFSMASMAIINHQNPVSNLDQDSLFSASLVENLGPATWSCCCRLGPSDVRCGVVPRPNKVVERRYLAQWVDPRAIKSMAIPGLCKGIYPQNMAKNMVQYLHFRILEFPLINGRRRPSLQGIRYGRYGSKLVNQQIWMILKEEPTQCVRR